MAAGRAALCASLLAAATRGAGPHPGSPTVAAKTQAPRPAVPLDLPPLCPAHNPTQPPTHTTVGFITSPNSTEWATNYCWSQLTHVAWCHLELAATGNLTPAWVPSYWDQVPALVAHIHQSPWTRVLLTVAINGHQYDPRENKTETLLDRSTWPTFFAALAARIREADADGAMFDIEHIEHIKGGLAAYGELVLHTAAYLRKQPRPAERAPLQTMLCTAQYTRVLKMNYTALASGLDALFLMDYSDHGVGAPFAGPVTQLHSTVAKHRPPACTEGAGYGNLPGIDGLLAQWAALGVAPDKMVLGLPWFGAEWPVAAGPGGAPIKGAQPVAQGDYECGGAGCGWNGLAAHQLADPATQRHWDDCMEQPYYNRRNASGAWIQGWYDNRTSLVKKYERAKQAGLQGVGVWGLWYGTMPRGAPLWHSLADSFSPAHKAEDQPLVTRIHGGKTDDLSAEPAAAPAALHPASGQTISMPLPYFSWTDVVPWPHHAFSYEIKLHCAPLHAPDSRNRWEVVDRVPAIVTHWSPSAVVPWQPASCTWEVCALLDDDPIRTNCSPSTQFSVVPSDYTLVFRPEATTWDDLHNAFRAAAADPATVTEIILRPGLYELEQNSTACSCDKTPDECTCAALFHCEGNAGGVIVNGPGATLRIHCSQPSCGFFGAIEGCVDGQCWRPGRFHVSGLTVDYDNRTLAHIAARIVQTTKKGFRAQLLSGYSNAAEFSPSTEGFFLTNRGGVLQRNANADRVGYTANTTWDGAAGRVTVDMFAMKNIEKYVATGDVWASMFRGGDMFLFDATDVAVFNFTSLVTRGRFWIPRAGARYYRCVNNRFIRRPGLALAAASGGINDHGMFSWYQSTAFEWDRDDMLNMDHGWMVYRQNRVTGAFRNSAWLHGQRVWYADNIVQFAGVRALTAGGVGISHAETNNSFLHSSIIENNTYDVPNLGIVFNDGRPGLGPDPSARNTSYGGFGHTNVVFVGNTIRGTRKDAAIVMSSCTDCVLSNSTVVSADDRFEPTSDPAQELGIVVNHSQRVALTDNAVEDQRLRPGAAIVVQNSVGVVRSGNRPPAHNGEKTDNEGSSYPVYYNVDQGTAGKGGIPREPYPPLQVDVTKWGLRPLNETQGERACILPGCNPWTTGAFPLLECDSQTGRVTKMANGGTPQQGNLSLHLQLIRETLPSWIPDEDWSGNAVIDFEAWVPVWAEMTKHAFGTCYQNRSRALVLAAHPSWNVDQVEAAASREWEAAATNWLVQTIRTCVGIRPQARWGYYGLPKRGHDGGQANRPPWSDYAEKQLPIFEASRALYPSIYLHLEDTPEENEQMVRNLLNETLTLASHVERVTGRRLPVLPYAWEFYGDRGCCALLSDADLETSLALPKELGASGVVIWGSLHMANATVQQEYWRYFKEKTGPLVMRIHGGKNAAPVSAPLKCDDHHHFNHSHAKRV